MGDDMASITIALSGYYGYGNSGDEAVLHAIVQALREEADRMGVDVRPIVLSGNPAATERVHGVEAVHRMRLGEVRRALREADALISGGGSLLQDVTSPKSIPYYLGVLRLAQWMGKPTFVYAQGIGPVRRKTLFGPMIRSVFRAARYVSVRDEESKALLSSFGLEVSRIDVVPDPVMGLCGEPSRELQPADGGPVIGLSVRYWRDDRRDLQAIADGIALALDRIPVAKIRLLPFHLPDDREASLLVADRLCGAGIADSRIETHEGAEHPDRMLRETAACDVLVGMRLHSLIYAATSFVPPIGVSYDPKIDQFLNRIDETAVGSTDALSPEALAHAIEGKIGSADAWRISARKAIADLQRQARIPAQQIVRELRI